MKITRIIIIFLMLSGCATWMLRDSERNLDIERLATLESNTYDIKTIKQLYGNPDIVDKGHGVEIYASQYEYSELFDSPTEFMIFYFVMHTKGATEGDVPVEIYREHFSHNKRDNNFPFNMTYDGKGPCFTQFSKYGYNIRKSYNEILECCKKLK